MLGGAKEALYIDNNNEENNNKDNKENLIHKNTIIINKKHIGFIRLALETGTSIVPVFTLGENYLFNVIPISKHPLFYQKFNLFMIKVYLYIYICIN